MKVLNEIRVVLLVPLFVFYLSCTKKPNVQYLFSDKKIDTHYKIIYNKDTILYVNILKDKKSEKVDTSIYIKKTKGYYENVNDPFTDRNQRLIFSTNIDTLYNYNHNLFYCKISKLDCDKFKTTFANYDSLTYKYRHSTYYDKNYNIYKIEEVNNKGMLIYK